MNTESIVDGLDPDLQACLTSRRNLFAKAAITLGVAATVPTMLAAVSSEAFGQGAALPGEVVSVLNFALTLEYLEAEFYSIANSRPGLIPPRLRPVFRQIGKHEIEHVRTLLGALGPAAVPKPRFDFTGRGQYPGVFSNFGTFALLSQTFEDTGVAAYKGQAPNLMGTPALLPALRIHSVEARHAAEVRRVRGVLPWNGAFDAPLSREQVLAAVAPFIASPLG